MTFTHFFHGERMFMTKCRISEAMVQELGETRKINNKYSRHQSIATGSCSVLEKRIALYCTDEINYAVIVILENYSPRNFFNLLSHWLASEIFYIAFKFFLYVMCAKALISSFFTCTAYDARDKCWLCCLW